MSKKKSAAVDTRLPDGGRWRQADAGPRDAARGRLRRRRFREAAGRHRLDLEQFDALQHAHRRAGAHGGRGRRAGGRARRSPSIRSRSDGISMGTPGMRYSLVSREVIADSIETVVGAQGFDGVVAIGGCDKNMPGCLMAMARLDRPAVFVYGGTIRPGPDRSDIVTVFEAIGGYARGAVSEQQLKFVERTAIPGPGSCAGMYTANTMASAIEALGMSLPNSSAQDAVSGQKREDCARAGAAVVKPDQARHLAAPDHDAQGLRKCDHRGHRARRLDQCGPASAGDGLGIGTSNSSSMISRASASACRCSRICGRAAVIRCPSSWRSAASSRLMKTLLDAGLLHGDCLTVTGQDARRESALRKPYPADQQIVRPLADPIKKDSHLVVLYGNLAPEGAVAKITGKEGLRFEGTARVFDSEEQALQGHPRRQGHGRRCRRDSLRGPKGRTRHARDAESDRRHHGQGPRQGRRADHRRPLLRRQPRLRRRPCVAGGGGRRPARAREEWRPHHDRCASGAKSRSQVGAAELRRRRKAWTAPRPMRGAACWRSMPGVSAAQRSVR
jgi:hypothetical protein